MSKPRCGRFDECRTCINREFDPFQCDTCEDGSNYEPEEEGDDIEEIGYGEFLGLIRQAA